MYIILQFSIICVNFLKNYSFPELLKHWSAGGHVPFCHFKAESLLMLSEAVMARERRDTWWLSSVFISSRDLKAVLFKTDGAASVKNLVTKR